LLNHKHVWLLIQQFYLSLRSSFAGKRKIYQVSISSTLYERMFRTNVVFSSYMYVEKMTFIRKIRTFNVDEIDYNLQKTSVMRDSIKIFVLFVQSKKFTYKFHSFQFQWNIKFNTERKQQQWKKRLQKSAHIFVLL